MHRGCQVEAADGHLVCPCHGSEYDNAGAILKGPTELPLIRFPVEVDAENIYVGLEEDGRAVGWSDGRGGQS
jgi:Rieske Fe-S protein